MYCATSTLLLAVFGLEPSCACHLFFYCFSRENNFHILFFSTTICLT